MANIKSRPVKVFLAVVGIAMLCTVLTLVLIVHAPWYDIVNEVIGQCIFTMFILILYEPLYKKIVTKNKLSVSYKITALLFLAGISFLYAGYMVKTVLWLCVDWGIALVFGIAGLVWYYKVYGNEDKIANWADQKMWAKRQKMYKEKGLTEAEILEDAKKFLEFHTVGDSLEGALDFTRPMSAEGYTIAEMVAKQPNENATLAADIWVTQMVHRFVESQKNEKEEK